MSGVKARALPNPKKVKENPSRFFWKKLGEDAASQNANVSETELDVVENKDCICDNVTEIVTTGLIIWNARGLGRRSGMDEDARNKKKTNKVKKNFKIKELLRITGVKPRDFIFGQESHLEQDARGVVDGSYKHSGVQIFYSNRSAKSAGVFVICS